MNMFRFPIRQAIKVLLIAFFAIAGYYLYRGIENYLYLQDHYFNTNFKDTRQQALPGRLVLQNTTNLQLDTVDLLEGNLILNYSATWCQPCLSELPLLTELHKHQADHRYRIYFILEEENKAITQFSIQQRLAFPAYRLVSKPSGPLSHSVYPVTLICKAGRVELKHKRTIVKG